MIIEQLFYPDFYHSLSDLREKAARSKKPGMNIHVQSARIRVFRSFFDGHNPAKRTKKAPRHFVGR
jgi:hypothetical protein